MISPNHLFGEKIPLIFAAKKAEGETGCLNRGLASPEPALFDGRCICSDDVGGTGGRNGPKCFRSQPLDQWLIAVYIGSVSAGSYIRKCIIIPESPWNMIWQWVTKSPVNLR